MGLCGKQDEEIGHSIASTALALAILSLGLLHLKEKGGHRGGQTGQNRTEGHVSVSYWSLANDRYQPRSPRVAVLPPSVIGGPFRPAWI